jgi:hypothetical protein
VHLRRGRNPKEEQKRLRHHEEVMALIDNDNGGVVEKASDTTPVTTTIESQEPVYSVYDAREKWCLVGLVAVAGLFR